MTPESFINKYLPVAQYIEQEWEIPAIVTLTIAAGETTWGKNSPGYNMFGYSWFRGSGGQRQLLKTKEYHPSPNVKYPVIISITKLRENYYLYWVRKYFCCYNNTLDSFTDFAKMISFADRYQGAFDYNDDPERFLTVIFNAGYSTDKSWYNFMISVMQSIKKRL